MNLLFAHLLEAAQRAPSAHNTQPWLLAWQENEVQVSVSPQRLLAVADAENADALYALGALLENLMLTLLQLGFVGNYSVAETWNLAEPVVSLRWRKANGSSSEQWLYRMIPIRRTSRVKYLDEPIPAGVLEELGMAVTSPCRLHVLSDRFAVREIRQLAAKASTDSFLDRRYVQELYGWMRFSRRDSRWYRDGLTAECMGWNRFQSAMIRQLLKPRVVRTLARLSCINLMFGNVNQQAPDAPALCLLTTRDSTLPGRIEAGRNLQHAWLTAAAHGLATHPLSAALENNWSRLRVMELFGADSGEMPVNLFRLGISARVARSPRLPADELLAEPLRAATSAPKERPLAEIAGLR